MVKFQTQQLKLFGILDVITSCKVPHRISLEFRKEWNQRHFSSIHFILDCRVLKNLKWLKTKNCSWNSWTFAMVAECRYYRSEQNDVAVSQCRRYDGHRYGTKCLARFTTDFEKCKYRKSSFCNAIDTVWGKDNIFKRATIWSDSELSFTPPHPTLPIYKLRICIATVPDSDGFRRRYRM